MSKHTPYVEETIAADCVYGDCEHEGDGLDDCPTIPKVLCQGCMDVEYAEHEDEAKGIEWPCPQATQRSDTPAVKQRLLDEYRAGGATQ